MNKVSICLVGSDKEVKDDLHEVTGFLRDLSHHLDGSEVDVSVIDSENGNHEAADGSDMFTFLVGSSVSDAALSAFDAAVSSFMSAGKPAIYVYFRDMQSGAESDETVDAFRRHVEGDLGLFCGTFTNPDSLKLSMVMELSKIPSFTGDLSFRDGHARFGDVDVLSLADMPFYAGNEEVTRLRRELERLNAAYIEAVEQNASEKPETLLEHVDPIVRERSEVVMELHELEADLESLYELMHSAALTNSECARRAIELIKEGDYDAAIAVLEDGERENVLEHAQALSEAAIANYKEEEKLIRELERAKAHDEEETTSDPE